METSRTDDSYRSGQRHRSQSGGCIQRSRPPETSRNNQPITTLPGEAKDVWSALPLYPERAENRSIGVGAPQSVSNNRDLRATSDQPHYSALGKIGSSGCG